MTGQGMFTPADRAEFLKEAALRLPAVRQGLQALPQAEREALAEAAMLGLTLAFFAQPQAEVTHMARLCEVKSRRLLFVSMRAMSAPGSGFRRDAELVGLKKAEPEIRRHLVQFARHAVSARAAA